MNTQSQETIKALASSLAIKQLIRISTMPRLLAFIYYPGRAERRAHSDSCDLLHRSLNTDEKGEEKERATIIA